jgi:hypothetical protein
LVRLNIGRGLHPFGEGSEPYGPITHLMSSEVNEFLTSEQNQGGFEFSILNRLNYAFLAISIAVIFYYLYYRVPSREIKSLLLIVISDFIINALISAGLSGVHDRYQSRVCWLILFAALICFCGICSKLLSKNTLYDAL